MADHSQKWHDGTSTRIQSSDTSDGYAAIQAQLNNLSRELKKVNQKVYVAQVGCKQAHQEKKGRRLKNPITLNIECHFSHQEGIKQLLQDFTKGTMEIRHIKKRGRLWKNL